MERFIFDLQRFDDLGINMESGTKSSPKEIPGYSGSDKLTNLMGNYVHIDVDGGDDTIITSSSKHVTIDAGAGNDEITAAAMEDVIINGEGDNDSIKVTGSTQVTVDSDEGNDVVSVLDSSKVEITAGAGTDDISIGEGSSDVTITAGAGADTIRLSTDSKNVKIIDLAADDTIVLSDFEAAPRFATFTDGVLNLDGVKINVGADYNTDTAVTVTFGEGETTKTLNKLLEAAPPVWKVTRKSGKPTGVLSYYSKAGSDGKLLATLTGLNKTAAALTSLSADADTFEEIPGITVDVNNNIILSSNLLPTSGGTITLAGKDYKLALEDEEIEFISTGKDSSKKKDMGFSVAGASGKVKTATFLTSAKSNGWYVGDDGKKLKFLKANAVSTTFSVGNLAAGTSTVTGAAESNIEGLEFDISGNTGTVTISKADIFAKTTGANAHSKTTINGEDVKFNFTEGVEGLEVVGGKTDENIFSSGTGITLSTAAGNDWVTDHGNKNKIDLGAGNDYFFGNYASDTVIAGAGDDFVQLLGNYNTINAGAGNDIVEFDGGVENTVNADAGNDFVSVNSDATISKSAIIAGAGNDTVSIVGGFVEDGDTKTYKFNGNTVDLGAGNDFARIENVSDTAVIASAGNNSLNFNGVSSGISFGGGVDSVNINYASDTSVVLGAGNDILKVDEAYFATFEGGAGNDSATFSNSTVANATIKTDAGADHISIIGGAGEGNIFNTGADNDNIFASDTRITGSTISGGFGNDVISLVGGAGSGNVIYYNYGGGNDTIYGFTNDDQLVIAGENNMAVPTEISQVTIGKGTNATKKTALIVNVGKGGTAGTITLFDWDGDSQTFVSNITSGNAMEKQIVWTVSAGTATGNLNGKTVAKITGLKVASSTETDKAKKNADIAAQNAAIAAALSDNGDTIIIGDGALNSAATAKLAGGAGYTLAFAEDVSVSSDTSTNFTIQSGVADFGTLTTQPGYKLSDDKLSVSYIPEPIEKPGPIISGVDLPDGNDSSCFVLDGTTVYLSDDALPTLNESTDTGISISSGFKLGLNTVEGAIGGEVEVSEVTAAGWQFDIDSSETDTTLTEAAILKTTNIPKGYYLIGDGSGIGYRTQSDAQTLVTVHGLKFNTASKDLVVSDKPGDDGKYTITVSKAALNDVKSTGEGSSIYLDDTDTVKDYKLVLGQGVAAAKLTNEGWKASGTTAYYQTRKVAKVGYAVSEDGQSIDYYTDDDGDNTVVTLTGLKSKMGTSANLTMASTTDEYGSTTTTITVGKNALGGTDIELEVSENYSDDSSTYELALAEDITSSTKISDAAWNTVKGGNSLQFVSAKYSEGYGFASDEEGDADKTRIVYTAAHGGKVDIKIAGLNGATVAGGKGFVEFKDNSTSDTVVLNVGKFADSAKGASVTAYSDVESDEIKAYGFELSGAGKLTNSGARGVSLIGSSGNDILVGNAGKDTLLGNAGDDNLNGGAGNDYIDGGAGKDILAGGNGNDILHSGAGEGDSLNGGNGNDALYAEGSATTLTGGTGKDIFVHAGTGETTITDYAAGADVISVAGGLDNAKVKVDGSKVIFTISDGHTITVNNGKNKVITLTDGTNIYKNKYTSATEASVSENIAEMWFEDESEFANGETLADILNSEVVGESLENYDPEKVTQEKLIAYASK